MSEIILNNKRVVIFEQPFFTTILTIFVSSFYWSKTMEREKWWERI